MAFLYMKKKCNCQLKKSKPSPSSYKNLNFSPKLIKNSKYTGRLSPSVPSIFSGSMSVEAAAVLPIFLCFMVNLIFYMEVFRLHSQCEMALREVGNKMAVYGHIYKDTENGEEGLAEQTAENIVFSYLYVKNEMIERLGKEYLETSPMTDGTDGMNLLRSRIMQEGDIIDLILTYRVSPMIRIAGFPPFYLMNRYYGRAFTGYEPDLSGDENGEPMVYLAENGTVYHSTPDCPCLRLSVRPVPADSIVSYRNEDGEKYRACPVCGGKGSSGTVYITEWGECYHSSPACSTLRRSVTAIPVSEATRFPMCSKCGKPGNQEEK